MFGSFFGNWFGVRLGEFGLVWGGLGWVSCCGIVLVVVMGRQAKPCMEATASDGRHWLGFSKTGRVLR